MNQAAEPNRVSRALWVSRAVGARRGAWVAGAALLGALPFLLASSDLVLVAEMLILALFALSYNLMLGYMGMPSLGHAGFYGLGAYTTGILMTQYGVDFVPAFVAAPVLSALVGIIVGYLSIRRYSFVYFSMLTLASAQVLFTVAWKWVSLTGGDDGLIGVPVPAILRQTTNFYYFTLGIVLISTLVMYRLVNSPYGYLMQATRENPTRAQFMGVPVTSYRVTTFAIAAFFAGLAGAIGALLQRGAFTEFLSIMKTMDALIAVLLGGMYVFFGPVVGAAAVFYLNHYVTLVFPYWRLVIGVVLILIAFFFRQGLVGFAMATVQGIRARRMEAPEVGLAARARRAALPARPSIKARGRS